MSKLTNTNQLMIPDALAEYLGVSRKTVLSWRGKYGMPYVKIGDTVLIPEPQFLKWAEKFAKNVKKVGNTKAYSA